MRGGGKHSPSDLHALKKPTLVLIGSVFFMVTFVLIRKDSAMFKITISTSQYNHFFVLVFYLVTFSSKGGFSHVKNCNSLS